MGGHAHRGRTPRHGTAGWGSTTAATVSALSLGIDLGERFALEEVLRLYPPSFMIARTVTEHTSVYPFELGDLLVMSPWLMHRSRKGWTQPDQFSLQRWRSAPKPPWFLPFGIGPRRCPAASFARLHAAIGVKELYRYAHSAGSQLALVEGRSPALVPATLSAPSLPTAKAAVNGQADQLQEETARVTPGQDNEERQPEEYH
jgi:hypothetical protein